MTAFSFEFVCYDDSREDESERDGSLDLDDFQVVFDPYNKQIRINLSGEQVEYLRNCRSADSRILPQCKSDTS